MRLIPLGVAVVALAMYFVGLGEGPFIDPPEGFHAAIAQGIAQGGDWVTYRLNGVRYFDKPPLLYWLMAASFGPFGPTPFAARVWPALGAVGCAAVTARVGVMLGGPRVGLLAGLMTVTTLGFYVFGRLVKPDLLFVLFIVLAYAGFAAAYLGRGGRWPLVLFYVSLGLTALAKDVVGGIGVLLTVAMFFWMTRERPIGPWVPWWGPGLTLAVALPWYLAVEAGSRGFLWYRFIDHHVLRISLLRQFPAQDVPLGALEFLAVTVAASLPWSAAAVLAMVRTLRSPWPTPVDRLWVLITIWPVAVIGFFTFSPFKLPHYGLPAFPALALLAARAWDEAIARDRGAPRARTLLVPVLAVFALAATACAAAAAGVLSPPPAVVAAVDETARSLAAQGDALPPHPLAAWVPVLVPVSLIFAAAACVLAVAVWRRSAELGVAVALAAVLAFLPLAGRGMAEFARGRSAAPIAEELLARLGPDDLVIHEGPLEGSGSLLLRLERPVRVVGGLNSNLAFGATFPEARDIFWSEARVRQAWTGPGRRFLISAVGEHRSMVRTLPPDAVHQLATRAGRRLYSNLADRRTTPDH